MSFNADNFNDSRRSINSVTKNRIKQILSYILECHRIFLLDNVKYSIREITSSGTVMFEDHLKFEFVENYLTKYKHLLKNKISELEEINFLCEPQKRYRNLIDGKIKPDKIDIYINKLGLSNFWNNETDENLYFALECKRIKIKSDSKDYVSDIEKFSNREHTSLRLPFEGQIAFIENSKLDHEIISNEINSILKSSNNILTESFLTSEKLHTLIRGSYFSIHKRNNENLDKFHVYHLMFNYSKAVVN